MRLFVTEFITGGGIANDPLPESLKQEGQLMLQAVLNDCLKMDDIQLVTTRDARIPIDIGGVEIHVVENAIDYMQQLALIARQCDVTWVIAPESEGILETLITHLKEDKNTMVNCDAESIRITGDKLICATHLAANDIPTVRNLTQDEISTYENSVMIKDRYGVGCEGLMRCDTGREALQYIDDTQWVVQPYLQGEHLSISILFSSKQAMVISLNEQVFSHENKQPKLTSCLVNAHPVNDKIQHLADRLLQVLPGLRGYVGVDVILSEDEYYVIDINPRLTSSYVGLCDVLEENPAELCINSVLDSNIIDTVKTNNCVIEVRVA